MKRKTPDPLSLDVSPEDFIDYLNTLSDDELVEYTHAVSEVLKSGQLGDIPVEMIRDIDVGNEKFAESVAACEAAEKASRAARARLERTADMLLGELGARGGRQMYGGPEASEAARKAFSTKKGN